MDKFCAVEDRFIPEVVFADLQLDAAPKVGVADLISHSIYLLLEMVDC